MKPERREIEDELCRELAEAEEDLKMANLRVLVLRDAVYGISHPGSYEEAGSKYIIKDAAERVEERKQS